MLVYALTEPIDAFDGLTPLPQWIAENPVPRTRWALQAILALADAATEVRWTGDMRHLPSVGATLTPPATSPYLIVKQDNNGTTFVVADAEIPLLTDLVERHAGVQPRLIGAWTHPTHADIVEAAGHQQTTTTPADSPGHGSEPPF